MALIWKYGCAFIAVDDGDPTGPAVYDPKTKQFDNTHRWERLSWRLEAVHAGWKLTGYYQYRELVRLYLDDAAITEEQAQACAEAIRKVLTPLTAGIGEGPGWQPFRWVETPDSIPLDRCTPGHHVWKAWAKDEDFCLCGHRHLKDARMPRRRTV